MLTPTPTTARNAIVESPALPRQCLNTLVIEDSDVDFRLLLDVLEETPDVNRRFNIERLACVGDLLNRSERSRLPDVVLLDLHLPDAAGLETLNRVQHLLPELPMVIMTGSCDDQFFDHALSLGFQDFMRKGLTDAGEFERRIRLSVARHEHTHRLFHRANHDVLTGLANRGLFRDRLAHALERGHRSNQPLALMLIDVDDFKTINDTHGHETGDIVLRSIAQTMTQAVRQSDTVGRLGGDEFGVLLEDVPYPHAAFAVANKILAASRLNTTTHRGEENRSLSIGIAIYEPGAQTIAIETLFQRADTALYRAKHNGKNRYCTYTESLEGEMGRRLRFDNDIQLAANRNEFVPFYQPIVNLDNDSLCGIEMLMRWPHPGRGMILPGDTVPALERMHLIAAVSTKLIQQSLRQFKVWRDASTSTMRLALNISPSQLSMNQFVTDFEQIITDCGLAPHDIQIEITENLFLEPTTAITDNLQQLNRLGVAVIVDDFGMGHGSFGYLKRFHVGGIKIDRSVIAGVTTNRMDAAIAKSMVQLAQDAELEITAEGIENDAQNDAVRAFGMARAQGFLHGHPMDAATFSSRYKLPLETSVTPHIECVYPTRQLG